MAAAGLTDACQATVCGDDLDLPDKVLYRSGGGITLRATDHEVERQRFVRPTDGEPLSDHDPMRVQFEWTLQDAAFFGTVTDAQGAPVADAIVIAFSPDDGWFGSASAVTDVDGTYAVAVCRPTATRCWSTRPGARGWPAPGPAPPSVGRTRRR